MHAHVLRLLHSAEPSQTEINTWQHPQRVATLLHLCCAAFNEAGVGHNRVHVLRFVEGDSKIGKFRYPGKRLSINSESRATREVVVGATTTEHHNLGLPKADFQTPCLRILSKSIQLQLEPFWSCRYQ